MMIHQKKEVAMNMSRMMLVLSVFGVALIGCSTAGPQPRLADYLGPISSQTEIGKQGTVSAGLVVINDTSVPQSAPQLSEESFKAIKKHVQGRLTKEASMALVPLNFPNQSALPVDMASLFQQAQEQRLDYVVLAVVSSTEIEVPDRLPLQGALTGGIGRGLLNGYRAENYALAELALLDVKNGQTLLLSNGQSWASLERLDVPLKSNVFPVVRRNLEIPPIYPTSEDRAHDVMRAVASSDAIDQAVMHFRESWKQAKS
jgi:hypothetical protein